VVACASTSDEHLTVAVIATATPVTALGTGVEVRGVWHTYSSSAGPVRALEPIDLAVASGELLAILGPSGCGKSTLLRAMAGLLAPMGGEVRLDGETPQAARRRLAIGWLAQEDGLLPWRSVAENVALPLCLAGLGRDARASVQLMLERVGLAGSGRNYPHELSGGMRQRAALARALVARPACLLLDEPFAHLDELTRERLGDLLLELRALSSPTAVLVTHSVNEAVRLADRVVVLSGSPGRVVLDQPIHLARPRREDQPGFGEGVAHLKSWLGATSWQ
jgi:NitT/TauT family transport system ATP-binding protein